MVGFSGLSRVESTIATYSTGPRVSGLVRGPERAAAVYKP